MKKTVAELAEYINGQVISGENVEITGITNIDNPKKGYITFAADEKTLEKIEDSEISCVIVPDGLNSSKKAIIQANQPKLAFANLIQLFNPPREYPAYVSEKAEVSQSATLGENVHIEAFAVIRDNAFIGDNTVIKSGVSIDRNVRIGKNTVIHANVSIYENSIIGDNVIIHSGTVIGSDGFGFTRDSQGNHSKVPQIGNVIIEDHVEIGANCTIDCATFGSTVLGKGTKLDNMVQVAHNVQIGQETAISGQSGIAGSSKIGQYVTMGAQVGIADHVTIDDMVIIGGKSGVASKKHVKNGMYMGTPIQPIVKFAKTNAMINRLPKLVAEVKEIKKSISV